MLVIICDVCKEEKKSEDVIGFDRTCVPIRISMLVDEYANHICKSCANAIDVFVKGNIQ